MLHGFHGQSLVQTLQSVLNSTSLCLVASLTLKQGGAFAFCLMPMYEEAVLGPASVILALVLSFIWYSGACRGIAKDWGVADAVHVGYLPWV